MPSEMHHRNYLDGVIADPIDHAVREAMNEVASGAGVLVVKRPGSGRVQHCLDGSVNFVEELCA
jgi:hypothetical protein